MRRLLLLLVLLVALAMGCGSKEPASPTKTSSTSANKKEEGTLTKSGDLLTYVSIPWGFSTSSYVIEGSKGLVAIDTQFLPSAAEEMIAKAEAMTKKKFVLAIVLHPNPDKFNGTATFQKHGVKVITSEQVKKVMPEVHEKRVRAFYDRYAPDYPKDLPNPDVFGNATQEMNVDLAGVKLRLHVLGAGCSDAHVVVERPDTHEIFPGDMVANKHHSWLEIGKTDQWLARLDEMKKMAPKTVHPGRGASGPASLLDDEEAYLKKVISIVAAEKPTMPIQEEALGRAEKAITLAYPGYGHPVFLKIGLPAEWERQAKSSHAKP